MVRNRRAGRRKGRGEKAAVYACADGRYISVAPIEAKFRAEFYRRIVIDAAAHCVNRPHMKRHYRGKWNVVDNRRFWSSTGGHLPSNWFAGRPRRKRWLCTSSLERGCATVSAQRILGLRGLSARPRSVLSLATGTYVMTVSNWAFQ